MDEYALAFQKVMEAARTVSGISDLERTEYYEPLKTVVYDLLHSGIAIDLVTDEAVSWLRQNVQIGQSMKRVID